MWREAGAFNLFAQPKRREFFIVPSDIFDASSGFIAIILDQAL